MRAAIVMGFVALSLLFGCGHEIEPLNQWTGPAIELADAVEPSWAEQFPFASQMAREDFDYWDVPKRLNGDLISPNAPQKDDSLVSTQRESRDGNVFVRTHPQRKFSEMQSGTDWNGCHAEVQFAKGYPKFFASGTDFQRSVRYRMRFPDPNKIGAASGRIISQMQNYTSDSPNLYRPSFLLVVAGGAEDAQFRIKFIPSARGGAGAEYTAMMPASVKLFDGQWHTILWKFYASTASNAGRMELSVDGQLLSFYLPGVSAPSPFIERATIYDAEQNWDFQMGAYVYFGNSDDEVIIDYDDLLITDGHVEDFSSLEDWRPSSGASLREGEGSEGRAVLRTVDPRQSESSIEKALEYDVSLHPRLEVSIPALAAGTQWSIKVREHGGNDIVLGENLQQGGIHRFDLKSKTAWSGRKIFTIKITVRGDGDQWASFDYIHKLQ